MDRGPKGKKTKGDPREPERANQPGAPQVPERLTRSAVYQRVPVGVRCRLDEAIILRPSNCPTLEAIAEKFHLQARYKISPAALRSYAKKLEQLMRPAAAALLMGGVLGCLPERYRRAVAAGSQVLLLSRVVQVLCAEQGDALSVAELAKLAAVLSATSRPKMFSGPIKAITGGRSKAVPRDALDEQAPSPDPHKMAEAVRMLYGLPWPPAEPQ